MNSLESLCRARGLVLMAGLVIAGLLFASTASGQQPITYQGQLKQSGTPFTGLADLEFRLYDSLAGGAQVGSAIARNAWPVEDGLFQVELDFGAGSFGADPRWLQIAVDGTMLTPRQRVHAAPMAMFALAGNEGPPGADGAPGPSGADGAEGPPGDSHWVINGTATAYMDGNVGIGVLDPAGTLDVHGNSSIGLPLMQLYETEDDFARLTFANAVSDRFWSLAALTRGDNLLLDRFNLFHSVSGDLVRIDGEGNIGLGGNAPNSVYPLSVRGGMLLTRDSGPGTLAHLAITETAGSEAVRQLFWNSEASRGWRIDSVVDPLDPASERWSLSTTGTGVNADVLSVLGSRAVGIGYPAPPAALTVRSRDAFRWTSGNGRGDFYVGDGSVGLSMGVALGGGGRGVSSIWTKGGVEHLFIGSADHGLTMGILPGLVGINTGGPTATLDVNGSARVRGLSHIDAAPRNVHADAQGNLSTERRESFLAIPSTAFRPSLSSVVSLAAPTTFVLQAGVSGSSAHAIAPVTALPHGATVTALDIWFYDASPDGLLVILVECPHTATNWTPGVAGECTEIARVETTGQSVALTRTAQAPSLLGNLIDHELNAYHLFASSPGWDSDLFLRSARLRFEY